LLMLDRDEEAGQKMHEAQVVFHAAEAWFHEAQ
jgi:hypothetical protein